MSVSLTVRKKKKKHFVLKSDSNNYVLGRNKEWEKEVSEIDAKEEVLKRERITF